MSKSYDAGRHFLQIPGPTNVPDRILRAMDYPTIDHRGPQFAEIGTKCSCWHEDHLQNKKPYGNFSGIWDWSVGVSFGKLLAGWRFGADG